MPRKVILSAAAVLFILCFLGSSAAASTVTSWKFQILNDPDARQVAQNIASLQNEMTLSKDPIAQFIDGLNGRIMSIIQQDIVNKMLEDNIGDGQSYEVGDIEIAIFEDEQTGEVTIILTNKITGEVTEIRYNTDEWPTGEDLY
ncbi:MAG: curli assembly protein CsgF [Bacillota bacterium]